MVSVGFLPFFFFWVQATGKAKLFTKRSRSAGFQTVWVVDKKAKLWVRILSISFVVLEMESGSSLDLVQNTNL